MSQLQQSGEKDQRNLFFEVSFTLIPLIKTDNKYCSEDETDILEFPE
jgi:hypothetical protein